MKTVEMKVTGRRHPRVKPDDKWMCCKCGRVHELGAYVAAHWSEELKHDCECGEVHWIQRGVITHG